MCLQENLINVNIFKWFYTDIPIFIDSDCDSDIDSEKITSFFVWCSVQHTKKTSCISKPQKKIVSMHSEADITRSDSLTYIDIDFLNQLTYS